MEIKNITVQVQPDGRLNAKNAALYLGLSDKTLAMMRCKGEGPKFINMGRIFYFKTDLDQWIQDRIAQSTTEARFRKQEGQVSSWQ